MIRRMIGTVDILPEEAHKWQYLEATAREVFNRYQYKEIRTPLFEDFDLFQRSVGETTDIVSKEMYDFYDKGDRHNALRPEGTAGVVRAYIEHKLHGPEYRKPYKLYYMGPMFRYERPQAGRQRQFNQIGVEVFESDNPATDVEVIAMAWSFLEELGVKNLTLHINSLGKPQERQNYLEALTAYFQPLKDQLSASSQTRLEDNPLRILDSKNPEDQALVDEAPKIHEYLGEESLAHFQTVIDMLNVLGIPYKIDERLVRGLDYYQDTIFEIIANDQSIGAQSTVCGGGRYDGLVAQLGGPQTSGVGFGLGVERLLLLLDQQEIEIPAEDPVDVFVVTLGEAVNTTSLQLVQAARNAGLIAERDFMGRGLRAQFRAADRHQAKLTFVLGESELEEGVVQVRNQETSEQESVNIQNLLDDFETTIAPYL